MKLSIISLVGIGLASSNVAYGNVNSTTNQCAQTISNAQGCTKQCGDTASTTVNPNDSNGFSYGNLLLECIDQDASPLSRPQQLEQCCGMNTGACGSSMVDAYACMSDQLEDVKAKSRDYLGCIYAKKDSGECGFANFCVGILTGGHGSGAPNDFDVGASTAEGSLAVISRNAQTCDDMNVFGLNACEQVATCCEPCADKIAGVANAVINELLLPSYSATLSNCPDKNCAEYTTVRQLEATTESTGTTINVNDTAVVELTRECTDGLTNDIVVYNETFAIDNFFPCLYKHMGKIVAGTEETTLEAEESSSVSFFFVATSVTVSAIASTLLAMIA